MPLFGELTSPEIAEFVEKNALVLLPIGQTEEHGDHLPVDADTVIAERITEAAAQRLEDEIPVLVMRTVWAGYSGVELTKWPGTMRVRTRVIGDYVFDIIHSLAEMGFRKIATVNGHGHHPAILEMIAREIADAFTAAGLPVSKSEVILGEGAFRNIGEYDVLIHLHADVETTVKVVVVAEA